MPKHTEVTKFNKIPATSPDLRKDMLDKIREIYPALFGEGNSLNAKELQSLVDDYSKPEAERYYFPWAGKAASKRFAFTPSKARLVPDKERSVDFDTTQNLIIEGENLEVLKLLQASYFKKVKMIYIDPPYNTGHDFVYPDDYSESKQAYWEKNGVYHDGIRMDTNTESSGRYHSNWLSMMQSRLLLARNLLRDDGVIFVSIDDNEVHNLRKLMDEIFGEENFVATFIWQKRTTRENRKIFSVNHDYVVCYAKFKDNFEEVRHLFPLTEEAKSRYQNPDNDSRGPWQSVSLNAQAGHATKEQFYEITTPGGRVVPLPSGRCWSVTRKKYDELVKDNRIWFGEKGDNVPRRKVFFSEISEGLTPHTLWTAEEVGTTDTAKKEMHELFSGKEVFETPKPTSLIKRLVETATDPSDIVMDFFAGSGTTAHAVMELNKEDEGGRQFVLVQLPEATDENGEISKAGYKTISQITIERVKRASMAVYMRDAANKSSIKQVVEWSKGGPTKELLEGFSEYRKTHDIGFKVLRLSKSIFPQNLFEVDPDMTEAQKVKAWEEYLEKSKQSHLFDFKPDELLVEIALKDGFNLNFKAEALKRFKKNKVLEVSDGEKTALVCLDENIQEDTIKDLESYKERRFICLERAVDSTRKWNLKRMFGDNLWVA
jgi:adenine-specific DNA-methyltransferase